MQHIAFYLGKLAFVNKHNLRIKHIKFTQNKKLTNIFIFLHIYFIYTQNTHLFVKIQKFENVLSYTQEHEDLLNLFTNVSNITKVVP